MECPSVIFSSLLFSSRATDIFILWFLTHVPVFSAKHADPVLKKEKKSATVCLNTLSIRSNLTVRQKFFLNFIAFHSKSYFCSVNSCWCLKLADVPLHIVCFWTPTPSNLVFHIAFVFQLRSWHDLTISCNTNAHCMSKQTTVQTRAHTSAEYLLPQRKCIEYWTVVIKGSSSSFAFIHSDLWSQCLYVPTSLKC